MPKDADEFAKGKKEKFTIRVHTQSALDCSSAKARRKTKLFSGRNEEPTSTHTHTKKKKNKNSHIH